MRPGLSRAVPMGILGFLVGMVILVVIRGLQGLTPLMDPELAVILGTVLSAGFFVYGMGAFDPQMNQHAHEPAPGEEDHALAVVEEEQPAQPQQILGSYLWLLSSILLALIIVIVFFALLPEGPALRTVQGPDGNVSAVGYVPIPIGSETYYFSQLTVLLGFVIFMFISLAAVAGGLGFVLFSLNQGVVTVKDMKQTVIEADPLENVPATSQNLIRWGVGSVVVVAGFALIDLLLTPPITNEFATLSFFLAAGGLFTLAFILLGSIIRFVAGRTGWPWLVRALVVLGVIHGVLGLAFVVIWFLLSGLSLPAAVVFNLIVLLALVGTRMTVGALFAILSGILLPLFYFLLIGLVVPFAPPLLFIISASNALLIAALVLRPKFLTRWVGYGAAWTAKQLRRLPNALQ